jgi:hypothetical protein
MDRCGTAEYEEYADYPEYEEHEEYDMRWSRGQPSDPS